ncbi:hypothetical protein OPV22_009066 [Ensete ventricosum]|uniref:Uncharacterized protein n=1 Tax=Ensete ventricosum TaxID=4639 RepID=A0AAV8R9W8_ENSVE|nr:hypothetical protein OPV22_009066 [Ensete ventricosum]
MAAVSSDDWLLRPRTATCIFVPGGIGRQPRAYVQRRWARMNCSSIIRAICDNRFVVGVKGCLEQSNQPKSQAPFQSR